MGSSYQAHCHLGCMAPCTLLNYQVDELSPSAFDSALGAFEPCGPQPTMPLPCDSGSDQGWTTVPSQQQCCCAPKPTNSLEPPCLTHEALQGLPLSLDTSDSDPEDYVCPIQATVPVARTPMAMFAPNSVEAVIRLLNSANLDE